MALQKLTNADVQDAFAQMEASLQGARRTDQYVVQAALPIVEEVSTEEYRKIVDKRREDFVVGRDKLGYNDAGREIWEDAEARAESLRQEAELKKPQDASDKAKAKAKGSPARSAGEALLTAFSAGASSAAKTDSHAYAASSSNRADLDDMLQRMCGEIEAGGAAPEGAAGGVESALTTAQASTIVGKRRLEEVSETSRNVGTRAGKKQAKKKDEAAKTATKVIKTPTPAKDEVVKVKTEPVQVSISVSSSGEASSKVKTEEGSAVKQEVADGSSVKMSDWFSNGVVKEELAGQQQAPPMIGKTMKPKLSDDGGLWFFFLDAFEDDRASPPRVFLFGKVLVAHQYQSCCLVVENLERCFHLLLNVPDLDDQEAAKEMAIEAEAELKQSCPGLRKLRSSLKWRNYAFEKALPQGSGYLPFLKVVCDPSGAVPQSGTIGQAFSTVFGAQQSLLERLLLTRRIMGPSWLRLQPGSFQDSSVRLSFCPVELRITPSSISAPKNDEERRQLNEMGCPTSSPPLRMLTLSMQTTQRSTQHGHEPLAVACTMHPHFSPDAADSENHLKIGMATWRAVRRFDARSLPRDSERVLPGQQVEPFQSEQSLFATLLQKIQDFDPDVIACHNAYGFDLDVLASRMSTHKLQFWQKLGRLRRSKERMPRVDGRTGGFWAATNITAGRLVCDLALQAKDMLPKLSTFDLPSLSRYQLGVDELQEIEPENLLRYFDSNASLVNLADMTCKNALCIARLVHSLQILPLTKQLTNLAGNMWNMSLQNKRAERNEMLLCHEFHRAKFVLPDRENMIAKKRRLQADSAVAIGGFDDPEDGEQGPATAGPRRQKAAYTGGLVLDPKIGLYDEYVTMLDFNSLYPSIIQEHNICFTTVERPDEQQLARYSTEAEVLANTKLPDGTTDDGILPEVLRRLVSSRQQVKTALKSEKDPKRQQTLEIRQKALKLTANSMYGCLGFQNSRFYAKPLAALITAKGREALLSTITVVNQELSLEVVYGDTDSVFVNTKTHNYNDAMQAAQAIKRSVNKRYKKLEIEVDGVFGRLLLLKKKKYAGLKVVDQAKGIYEREYKGLDIVRRDWCPLAKGLGETILEQVLNCESKEDVVNWIHTFLSERCKEIDENQVPVEKFVITKGLTKAPQDYPDAKNQAHVQVALRLQARGKFRAGQEIEYVICESNAAEGTKDSIASRARHLSELQLDPTLRIDVAWYKSSQIHPLVSRLLGPLEGTDASRLAECLGLDGSRFASSTARLGAVAADAFGADYAAAAAADVDALLDRRVRFKALTSCLPGVKCKACTKEVAWKQLLQPEVSDASGINALFRCGECGGEVSPSQAQNTLTMQFRSLLRTHSEGWVQCADEAGLAKTRRQQSGQNLTSERRVLQELEFFEHLCSSATKGYAGDDSRGCRRAANSMLRNARWLLDTCGSNWVDCGRVFASICV